MACRADQTCELGMGGKGLPSSKPSQPAAPNPHLLAAVKRKSHLNDLFIQQFLFFLKDGTSLNIFLQEISGT